MNFNNISLIRTKYCEFSYLVILFYFYVAYTGQALAGAEPNARPGRRAQRKIQARGPPEQ